MTAIFLRSWWILLLRGFVALAFGMITWLHPGSLGDVALRFGTFALVDGFLVLGFAIVGNARDEQWWLLFFGGLVGVAMGAPILLYAHVTTLVLQVHFALWALGTGVVDTFAAVQLRAEIGGAWLLELSGLMYVLFGSLLILRPVTSAESAIGLISACGIAFGVKLVLLAFRARNLGVRLLAA